MIDVILNEQHGAVIVHDVKRLDNAREANIVRGARLLCMRMEDGKTEPLLTLSEDIATGFVDCSKLRIIRMQNYAVVRDFSVPLLISD